MVGEAKEAWQPVVKRLADRQSRVIPAEPALKPMDAEGSESSNPYVAQVIDYITEHLTEDIAIADIAEVLHLNAQYIMRLFKKEVGCSVLQYITAKRIALAVRYLTETNISVADVAILCGFDNYSYFIRIFKRFANETPVAFRKNVKSK